MNFEEHFKNQGEFKYKGKPYRIAREGGIVIAKDKSRLPDTLSRVIPNQKLFFDKNGILFPRSQRSDINDMVSLSSENEWEKFARMFYFDEIFKMITVDSSQLVGPTFLAGNRILHEGEVLGLVPKEAIIGEKKFSWTKAEDGYDYGETTYHDDYDRDFYQRLVVNRTKGFKPVEV